MDISIKTILKSFNTLKPSLACPIDDGMVEPKLGYDDEIIIYCLSCSWRQVLGENAKRNIVAQASNLTQN